VLENISSVKKYQSWGRKALSLNSVHGQMHRFWQASGHWIHGKPAASQDCRSQVRGWRIRRIVRPIFLQ